MAKIKPIFYVVRHGRTANNAKGNYRGWSNSADAQLSGDGKEDALQAAYYLQTLGIQFDVAIVDDLDRTQETAKIVCDVLGIKHIITDNRARPLNVGEFTGKSKEQFPLDDYMKDHSKVIPGGESLNAFNKRQAQMFDNIFETVEKTGKIVLFFGHGSNTCYLFSAIKAFQGATPVGYEGLVNPGGCLVFTDRGIIPLTNKREKKEASDKDKRNQWEVAYLPAKAVDSKSGTKCGECWKFIATGSCVEVEGTIEAEKTCTNYMHGTPFKTDPRLTVLKVDKAIVGYSDGNTHCESCEYFHGLDQCEKVKGFDGKENLEHIEAAGCCNSYEKK